jgi:hypothetical protein
MTDIAPSHAPSLAPSPPLSTPTSRAGSLRPGIESRAPDRVELSDMARYMSLLRTAPPIREDLVAHVRDLIVRGEYDTPERMDLALDAMAREERDLGLLA